MQTKLENEKNDILNYFSQKFTSDISIGSWSGVGR